MIGYPSDEQTELKIENETAGRLYDLAMVHYRNGDAAKGLEILDALTSSYPKMASLHVKRGSLQYAMKQFETALASFGAAIAQDSACAEAHFGIGAVAHAQGNVNEALSAYNRTLGIDPKHALAFNNRGLVLRELGEVGSALQSYDAAIDLLPDCPDFRFGKAMCCRAAIGRVGPSMNGARPKSNLLRRHLGMQVLGAARRSREKYC
jgi:tetratricopeptide (TPR) repeat protein